MRGLVQADHAKVKRVFELQEEGRRREEARHRRLAHGLAERDYEATSAASFVAITIDDFFDTQFSARAVLSARARARDQPAAMAL